jgi:hypothetical protein
MNERASVAPFHFDLLGCGRPPCFRALQHTFQTQIQENSTVFH